MGEGETRVLLAVLSARRTELRLARPDGGTGLKYVAGYISESLETPAEREAAMEAFLEREGCRPDSAGVVRPPPAGPADGDRASRSALRAITATDELLELTPAEAVARSVAGGCLGAGPVGGERVVLYTDGELDCAVIPPGGGPPRSAPIAFADPVYSAPQHLDFLCYSAEIAGRPSVGRLLTEEGLGLMYGYLRDAVGHHEPAWMAREVRSRGLADAVDAAVRSTERTCRLATAAARLLASMLRSEAVNCAVRAAAAGGCVLSGHLVRTAAAAAPPGWPTVDISGEGSPAELHDYLPVLAPKSCTRMDGLSRAVEETAS
jgi:hypothetical protein